MKKIVINDCYGGFSLSKVAAKMLHTDLYTELARDNAELVSVVEKLGNKASGYAAKLRVVEIPDNVEWTIEEYDGIEWVAEKHRTWR